MIKVKIISVTDNDYQKLFTAVGRGNEEFNNRSYFQHSGFTSIPKANDIGIVIEEGNTYTMVATAGPLDDRPELSNEGDVAIYASAEKYVMVKDDGEIVIKNDAISGGKITIKTNGDIELGSSSLSALIKDTIITKFNTHTHISAAPTFATSVPTPLLIPATDATSKVKGQ
jgi:phage gp45-like